MITAEVSKLADFKPFDKVLDVGCGIGGPAFHIAEQYGSSVHGIDFSRNMMDIAKERLEAQQHLKGKVMLTECDFEQFELQPGMFDVIHCRDTMIHVKDKIRWLTKFLEVLKPGGRLLITDYCRGKAENSEEYIEYISQRGYTVVTVPEYHKLIESVGLCDVISESRAKQYDAILTREIDKLEKGRHVFVDTFSEEEFDSMSSSWKAKLNRNSIGDHTWAIFTAKKPAS